MRQVYFFSILFLLLLIGLPLVVNGEIDEKTGTVTNIVDGDTFDLSNGDRIRPADIDAPEIGEEGYQEAKDYLTTWIYGKTVYLDVDDMFIYDFNGTGDRFVCVVYVSYNTTHYLNVNKLMLVTNQAVIEDFNNEFDPYSWSLFVLKPPMPSPTSTPISTSTPKPTPTTSPSPIPSLTPAPTQSLSPTLTPIVPTPKGTPSAPEWMNYVLITILIVPMILLVIRIFKDKKKE